MIPTQVTGFCAEKRQIAYKKLHPLISDDSDSLKYTWRDEHNFPLHTFYKFDGNFVCALIM